MNINEFTNWLKQLKTDTDTPMFANVYLYTLSNEQYSHLVTLDSVPCVFTCKRLEHPDSVFELDCFVEHNQDTDVYLNRLDEKLRERLLIQVKRYTTASYQEREYRQFSLYDAYLKGSPAWIQYMMQCIVLEKREWRDCQASQIIQDIMSDFANTTKIPVQFGGIWQDVSIGCFSTHWDSAYQSFERMTSITDSIMVCSSLMDGTIMVVFDKKERAIKQAVQKVRGGTACKDFNYDADGSIISCSSRT